MAYGKPLEKIKVKNPTVEQTVDGEKADKKEAKEKQLKNLEVKSK